MLFGSILSYGKGGRFMTDNDVKQVTAGIGLVVTLVKAILQFENRRGKGNASKSMRFW